MTGPGKRSTARAGIEPRTPFPSALDKDELNDPMYPLVSLQNTRKSVAFYHTADEAAIFKESDWSPRGIHPNQQ